MNTESHWECIIMDIFLLFYIVSIFQNFQKKYDLCNNETLESDLFSENKVYILRFYLLLQKSSVY